MIKPELHEYVKVLKELFDNMGSGVAIYEVTDDGKTIIVRDMNETGLVINQLKRENLIGKNLVEMFPGIKEFGIFDAIQRVWKTGKPEYFPAAFYQDDRISGWTENYVYKLPSGKVTAIFKEKSEYMEAEENYKKRIEFEKIIATNSSRFVNPDDI